MFLQAAESSSGEQVWDARRAKRMSPEVDRRIASVRLQPSEYTVSIFHQAFFRRQARGVAVTWNKPSSIQQLNKGMTLINNTNTANITLQHILHF